MKYSRVSFSFGLLFVCAFAVAAGPTNKSQVDWTQLTELKANPTPPAIHEAAARNQADEIKKIIADGTAADVVDPFNGWRPIHYAVFYEALDAAKVLAESNASLNIGAGPEMLTALHIAAIQNSTEMLQFLLRQGVSVNQRSANGYTPLHLAVLMNNEESVSFLLANGAAIGLRSSKNDSVWNMLMVYQQNLEDLAEIRARQDILPPQLSGKKICDVCHGTGKLSPEEVQRLASVSSGATVGSGRSFKIDTHCRNCDGLGIVVPAEDQQAMAAYKKRVHIRALELTAPADLTEAILTAFGGNPEIPSPQLQQKYAALKTKIKNEYNVDTWRSNPASYKQRNSDNVQPRPKVEQSILDYLCMQDDVAKQQMIVDLKTAKFEARRKSKENFPLQEAVVVAKQIKAEQGKLKNLQSTADQMAKTIGASNPDEVSSAVQKILDAADIGPVLKEQLRQEIASGTVIKLNPSK